eukprot:1552387-Rhodomonas_salina.1
MQCGGWKSAAAAVEVGIVVPVTAPCKNAVRGHLGIPRVRIKNLNTRWYDAGTHTRCQLAAIPGTHLVAEYAPKASELAACEAFTAGRNS